MNVHIDGKTCRTDGMNAENGEKQLGYPEKQISCREKQIDIGGERYDVEGITSTCDGKCFDVEEMADIDKGKSG
jgi:hypothetical protein